jgi:hypothetical protein
MAQEPNFLHAIFSESAIRSKTFEILATCPTHFMIDLSNVAVEQPTTDCREQSIVVIGLLEPH